MERNKRVGAKFGLMSKRIPYHNDKLTYIGCNKKIEKGKYPPWIEKYKNT